MMLCKNEQESPAISDNLARCFCKRRAVYLTRSQAVARIADRTALQQTI